MKTINIKENSSFRLEEEYLQEASNFINENKDLPLYLKGDTLTFEKFIIGSFRLRDMVINILPRITGLTTNHYLEMQLYNEGILDDRIASLLNENEDFGVQDNIIDLFLKETLGLAEKGLEGAFIKHEELTNSIRGKILVEKISPVDLFLDEIPVEYEIHTLNTLSNKIIKLALDKVRVIARKSMHVRIYSVVSSYFNEIDSDIDSSELELMIKQVQQTNHNVNEKYPNVIGLAVKILKELKINLKSNQVTSSSYLVNSNTVFEKYSRKILSKGLSANITKWDIPKPMGKFYVNDTSYVKSFSPDILLNYHTDSNTAYAILDAKNKDISDVKNVGDLADIYQIIFYCHALEANFGAIIYPCSKRIKPITFTIDSFKETNIFAFAIDFSKLIKTRHKTFVKDVVETLLL